MKKSKKEELKNLSVEELESRIEEAQKELFHLNTDKSVQKKAENPHKFPEVRRNIARMKTLLNQKSSN